MTEPVPELSGRQADRGPLGVLRAVAEAVCVAICAAIPLVLGGGVIGRYSGWFTLRWADEIARMLIVWLTFLGAGVATGHGAHLRIALMSGKHARPAVRRLIELVVHGSLIASGLLLIHFGRLLLGAAGHQTTVVLSLPMSWTFWALPVGGAMFMLYGAVDLIRSFRGSEDHRWV